jgi:hypothetical protein
MNLVFNFRFGRARECNEIKLKTKPAWLNFENMAQTTFRLSPISSPPPQYVPIALGRE